MSKNDVVAILRFLGERKTDVAKEKANFLNSLDFRNK